MKRTAEAVLFCHAYPFDEENFEIEFVARVPKL